MKQRPRETKTFHDRKYNLWSELFTDMPACLLVISCFLCVTLEPESGMQWVQTKSPSPCVHNQQKISYTELDELD